MADKVGLIGLGAMGLPYGRRLIEAGFELWVLGHRNMKPVDVLVGLGAHSASNVGELGDACPVVITSLPDVPQVRSVLFDEGGLVTQRRDGMLFIDMSTITPSASKEFHARLKEQGIAALDAPVSGGPARAADGTLTIMVGGETDAFERAQPILKTVGKHITHVGGPGAGQAVKLVNQLLISIIMVANAEALTLGVKAGVPLETLTEIIGTSSGSNYLMQNWLPKTLFAGDLDKGFALDLLMKDLRAALEWANELGSPAFGGALAQQLYRLAKAKGAGRLDYSIVAQLYEEASGVALRNGDAGV
ncbi:MAG TPA: NAD(P)-dependent oxidoreductase [Chloroflexia bacterium]|nr:NAD(P)-dependent oxidoreductase [Chloroflexia bacterium]